MAAMAVVNLALGLTTAVAPLYPLAVLYGTAFGALWCLIPAITSEIFGVEHFASLYTSLILAPALGCWLLAAQLAGRLYDAMSRSGGGTTLLAGGAPGSSRSSAAAAAAAAAAVGRSGSSSGSSGHMRRLQGVQQRVGGSAGATWLPTPRKLAAWVQGITPQHPATGQDLWHMPGSKPFVSSSSSSSSGRAGSGWWDGARGWARILCDVMVALLAAWPGGVVPLQGLGADIPQLHDGWQDPPVVGMAAGETHTSPAGAAAAAAALQGSAGYVGQGASRGLLLAGGAAASGAGPACLGPACFRLTFMLLSLLCCGAAVAAGRLVRLTRQVYVAQAAAAAAAAGRS
jgi:hypothetical protein